MKTHQQWLKERCVPEEMSGTQPLWSEWIAAIQADAQDDLISKLHQRDTALVECRKALAEAHDYVSGKTRWIRLSPMTQAIAQIDHALSQIQGVSNDK